MKTAKEFFEDKLRYEISPSGVKKLIDIKDNYHAIIDVRDADSYKKGHIPGAINLPMDAIDKNLNKLPKDKKLIIYCYDIVCFAAPKIALLLARKGYDVMELIGGFDEWKKKKFPIEK